MDLDCFFAQVERNRLGLPENIPLVVQQWSSLIAVDYNARRCGITRHMNIGEAKTKFLESDLASSTVLVSVPTAVFCVSKDAFFHPQSVELNDGNDPTASNASKSLVKIAYPPALVFGKNQKIVKEIQNLMAAHTASGGKSRDLLHYAPVDYNLSSVDRSLHKISLDSFRKASRAIFLAIRERIKMLCQECAGAGKSNINVPFEKASIDEFYIDLTELVNNRGARVSGDIEWTPDLGIVESAAAKNRVRQRENDDDDDDDDSQDDDDDDNIQDDNDDDISFGGQKKDLSLSFGEMERMLWEGSKIAKDLASYLYDKLGYGVSGGIAHDKMLAKLATGRNKPNQRTIIREMDRKSFLAPLKISDIPGTHAPIAPMLLTIMLCLGLGGKLGAMIEKDFVTIRDAWNGLPLPESIKKKYPSLDDKTALHVYRHLRGCSGESVQAKSLAKSLMSAKSFVPKLLANRDESFPWLFTLSMDLLTRWKELSEIEAEIDDDDDDDAAPPTDKKRRVKRKVSWRTPKTLNVTCRSTLPQQQKSKSFPFPIPRADLLNESISLEDHAMKVAETGTIHSNLLYPISHLSLSMSNFADGQLGISGGSGYKSITSLWAKKQSSISDSVSFVCDDSVSLVDGASSSSSKRPENHQMKSKGNCKVEKGEKGENTIDRYFKKRKAINEKDKVIIIDDDAGDEDDEFPDVILID